MILQNFWFKGPFIQKVFLSDLGSYSFIPNRLSEESITYYLSLLFSFFIFHHSSTKMTFYPTPVSSGAVFRLDLIHFWVDASVCRNYLHCSDLYYILWQSCFLLTSTLQRNRESQISKKGKNYLKRTWLCASVLLYCVGRSVWCETLNHTHLHSKMRVWVCVSVWQTGCVVNTTWGIQQPRTYDLIDKHGQNDVQSTQREARVILMSRREKKQPEESKDNILNTFGRFI